MVLHVDEIQIVLKNMIIEVTEICDRNNIDYYLVKGGLIGAVKYHNFIPWDPDVDFVIQSKDLEKFCECISSQISERYELCFYTEQKDYEYLFPRIGVKGLDYRQLHLDVFILASFPDEEKAQLKVYNQLYWFEFLNTLRNSKIRRPVNSVINRVALIIARVALFWIPRSYVRNKHLQILRTYDNRSKYVIHAGAVEEYGKKYIMPREWFGTPVKLQFGDIYLKCPNQFDKYLRQMYGDYECDPPVSEQKRQRERIWEFNDTLIQKVLIKDGTVKNKEYNQ